MSDATVRRGGKQQPAYRCLSQDCRLDFTGTGLRTMSALASGMSGHPALTAIALDFSGCQHLQDPIRGTLRIRTTCEPEVAMVGSPLSDPPKGDGEQVIRTLRCSFQRPILHKTVETC